MVSGFTLGGIAQGLQEGSNLIQGIIKMQRDQSQLQRENAFTEQMMALREAQFAQGKKEFAADVDFKKQAQQFAERQLKQQEQLRLYETAHDNYSALLGKTDAEISRLQSSLVEMMQAGQVYGTGEETTAQQMVRAALEQRLAFRESLAEGLFTLTRDGVRGMSLSEQNLMGDIGRAVTGPPVQGPALPPTGGTDSGFTQAQGGGGRRPGGTGNVVLTDEGASEANKIAKEARDLGIPAGVTTSLEGRAAAEASISESAQKEKIAKLPRWSQELENSLGVTLEEGDDVDTGHRDKEGNPITVRRISADGLTDEKIPEALEFFANFLDDNRGSEGAKLLINEAFMSQLDNSKFVTEGTMSFGGDRVYNLFSDSALPPEAFGLLQGIKIAAGPGGGVQSGTDVRFANHAENVAMFADAMEKANKGDEDALITRFVVAMDGVDQEDLVLADPEMAEVARVMLGRLVAEGKVPPGPNALVSVLNRLMGADDFGKALSAKAVLDKEKQTASEQRATRDLRFFAPAPPPGGEAVAEAAGSLAKKAVKKAGEVLNPAGNFKPPVPPSGAPLFDAASDLAKSISDFERRFKSFMNSMDEADRSKRKPSIPRR